MPTRSSAWYVLCLVLLVLGCRESSRQIPPAGRDRDAQPDTRDASDDSADADQSSPADTSVPTDARDAAPSRDAGPLSDAATPKDAAAPEDAATELEDAAADGGAPPVTPPRGDGCPEDAPLAFDRIRIRPAAGQGAQLVGALIQGSNSGPTTDFVTLATITQPPADGTFTELKFQNTTRYRYLRYYAPRASDGAVAELEFYHAATRLTGAAFGTAAISNTEHPYAFALDGDAATYFAPDAAGGAYVGLDIARGYVTQVVKFSPEGTSAADPLDVTLTSASSGAVIRYTLDGSNPTSAVGTLYSAPIRVSTGRTSVRAIASSACRFDSAISSATYIVGGTAPVSGGLRSYHLGNSLTDTINPWLEPIADSTGVDHVYARWTIPGAPIKWLAEHQGEGFEDPEGASKFDTFVQTFAPIDHLSLQPYSDPDFVSQGGAAVGFITKALQYSPNVQIWIYAQWPAQSEWQTDGTSNGFAGSTESPGWQPPAPPTNWKEGVENAALYFEAFRDYVDPLVGGKPLLIVPGGLALVELKRQIDAGMVPGYTDFFASMFEDDVHLKPPAQYLVSLVFYACLYRQTPEARVTFAGTGLTSEQALIFQRIAWNVASGYAGSGIQQ